MSILMSSVDVSGNLSSRWREGTLHMLRAYHAKIKWHNVGGDSSRLWKINKAWKSAINALDYQIHMDE